MENNELHEKLKRTITLSDDNPMHKLGAVLGILDCYKGEEPKEHLTAVYDDIMTDFSIDEKAGMEELVRLITEDTGDLAKIVSLFIYRDKEVSVEYCELIKVTLEVHIELNNIRERI